MRNNISETFFLFRPWFKISYKARKWVKNLKKRNVLPISLFNDAGYIKIRLIIRLAENLIRNMTII